MTKSKIKILILWASVIIWMLIIFCFSAQDADTSSDTSGGFAELLATLINRNFYSLDENKQTALLNSCQFVVRKAAHFSVYTVLGMLSLAAVRASKLKLPYIIAPAICLAYAVSDEIHQYFVPGRSCEFRDVCIDFSGSVSGIIIITLVFIIARKIKRKN